jgi:hypothetical protein
VGSLALIGIVALTSVAAYLVATQRLGWHPDTLPAAMGETLECLGLAAMFLAGNLAVGGAFIFGLRIFSDRFISVYGLGDIALALLSLLQAIVLQSWRRSR